MEILSNIIILHQEIGTLTFKISVLILLIFYSMFLLVVIQRIHTLNKTITVDTAHASQIMNIFAIVQFVLAVSLFLLALVIV